MKKLFLILVTLTQSKSPEKIESSGMASGEGSADYDDCSQSDIKYQCYPLHVKINAGSGCSGEIYHMF